MRQLGKVAAVLSVLVLLPAAAFAQASITGQVKDASGAVLPGVTIEVASPALLEKTRSATADGSGRYRLEILPPGDYTVTFSLAGFSTVKREGITLQGTFTVTLDAEMKVGSIQETVTVTGETPIVDVQSAARERVVGRELIDELPGGRTPFALTALTPGITPAGGTDVGGSNSLNGAVQMQVHGSTGNSTLIQENGLNTAALVGAWGSQLAFNMAAAQEMAVNYSGAGADANSAGVRMNMIPREGGNRFNGTVFINGASSGMQGNNFTERLQAAGLKTPDSIRSLFDFNPGFGGPIVQDKAWFYGAIRYAKTSKWASNTFKDLNFNNPNVWTYTPDLNSPVSNDSSVKDARLRVSWQALPKMKIGASYQQQNDHNFPEGASSTLALEATPDHYFPVERQVITDFTLPLTNRLLIDGAAMSKVEAVVRDPIPGLSPQMISVTDQASGQTYRARTAYQDRPSFLYVYRVSASYITGAHSFKAGIDDIFGYFTQLDFNPNPVNYRFNNGVPNQITMYAYPTLFQVNVDHQFGMYVQDRWTVNHLTVNAGLRLDWFKNHFPQQSVGPAPLAPTRNITFSDVENMSLKDLDPKLGVVYDLFGNGKTALKVGLNRYVEQYTVNGPAGSRNPINTLISTTTRSWTDSNRNFIPDCNLLNLGAQTVAGGDTCGAVANATFGSTIPSANFDPAILTGWGKRDYNWEFSTGVQHQIVRGVAADLSFYRRWYGNFLITDNLAVAASDYTAFSITAPVDARLPNGGGYAISNLFDVSPAKFSAAPNNYTTFADNYGKEINHWNGVQLNVTARLSGRLNVQGGIDRGTTTLDICAIRALVPELTLTSGTNGFTAPTGISNAINPTIPYCHTESTLTQVKLLGLCLVPKIDVQVSSTLQSVPGPLIGANFTATNALVQPSLGRSLAGSAANVSVNLVSPGQMYGERLNQLDFRFAKILRLAGTKTTVSLDLYNALNVDTVLTLNNAYASWQAPVTNMLARFIKIGAQFDF